MSYCSVASTLPAGSSDRVAGGKGATGDAQAGLVAPLVVPSAPTKASTMGVELKSTVQRDRNAPPQLPKYQKAKIGVLLRREALKKRHRSKAKGDKGGYLPVPNTESKVHSSGPQKEHKRPLRRHDGGRRTFDKRGSVLLQSKLQTNVLVKTQFAAWALNQAVISAIFCIVLGFSALVWGGVNDQYGLFYGAIGTYSVCLGIFIYAFEYHLLPERSPSAIPSRGFMYFAVGVPLFFTLPTILAGVCVYVCAITNCIAAFYEEEVKAPAPKRRRRVPRRPGAIADAKVSGAGAAVAPGDTYLIEPETCCNAWRAWWLHLQNSNTMGEKVLIFLYICVNIVLFSIAVSLWFSINQDLDEDDQISAAGPFAKGFGWTLDFNCAVILVPVCRTLITIIYENSNSQSCFSRILACVVTFVPIDHNIAAHKFIAFVMAFGACGHMFFHFVNYALRPDQTIELFGVVPWYTGGVIMLCILLIFSGALYNVKTKQFEIFWYTHIFIFPLFFAVLLLHGKSWYNPNFWKWFALPAVLYGLERIVAVQRHKKRVTLLSATLMKPNVFSLEIEKSGPFAARGSVEPYEEGMYCYINCPHLSRFEWHPFTISSAPSDKTVTFHIRVSVPGSWTSRLQDYLTSLGDAKTGRVKLHHQRGADRVPGKVFGPDGLPLLRVDGPHSAPTQHISKYQQVMVVGAGIGVTPVASSCKSVIFHRWRTAVGETFPNHAYFYWVCAHRDVDSFRWLVRLVRECQDEVRHQREKGTKEKARRFEFHIYVTSVPKSAAPVKVQVSPEDDEKFWGRRVEDTGIEKKKGPFSEADLYSALKCPSDDVKRMGDVFVHRGRPVWAEEFDRIKCFHPTGTVGIAFCGNKFIARDLKRFSMEHSDVVHGRLFRLHLENF